MNSITEKACAFTAWLIPLIAAVLLLFPGLAAACGDPERLARHSARSLTVYLAYLLAMLALFAISHMSGWHGPANPTAATAGAVLSAAHGLARVTAAILAAASVDMPLPWVEPRIRDLAASRAAATRR